MQTAIIRSVGAAFTVASLRAGLKVTTRSLVKLKERCLAVCESETEGKGGGVVFFQTQRNHLLLPL